jgi:hypothetical protein
MENRPHSERYAVTTLQLGFTDDARAAVAGSPIRTTFHSKQNLRVPVAGDRFQLYTSKGPVLFEVVEREFHFLAERTTVRLILDLAAER